MFECLSFTLTDRHNKPDLRLWSFAATTGDQGKLTYFMYFPWPPVQAALYIFFNFNFLVLKKFL